MFPSMELFLFTYVGVCFLVCFVVERFRVVMFFMLNIEEEHNKKTNYARKYQSCQNCPKCVNCCTIEHNWGNWCGRYIVSGRF